MKRTYTYKGYRPYGASDCFSIDAWVDDSFEGNATEECIKNGARFIVKGETARLCLCDTIAPLFVKED